jgi:hypothetical protein
MPPDQQVAHVVLLLTGVSGRPMPWIDDNGYLVCPHPVLGLCQACRAVAPVRPPLPPDVQAEVTAALMAMRRHRLQLEQQAPTG